MQKYKHTRRVKDAGEHARDEQSKIARVQVIAKNTADHKEYNSSQEYSALQESSASQEHSATQGYSAEREYSAARAYSAAQGHSTRAQRSARVQRMGTTLRNRTNASELQECNGSASPTPTRQSAMLSMDIVISGIRPEGLCCAASTRLDTKWKSEAETRSGTCE